jgi:plastocyanin
MSLSRHFQIGALGALAIGFAVAMAPGCSSDDKGSATGGSSGSTGGSSGSTGGSSGSTGGSSGSTGGTSGAVTPAFMNVAPCSSEDLYMKTDTIKATAVLKYMPACVQVKKGGSLKFDMDLAVHPLKKSTMRGDTTDNPIMDTATGMGTTVTFPKSGFFAFYCNLHGSTDTGTGMAGVVWVTD